MLTKDKKYDNDIIEALENWGFKKDSAEWHYKYSEIKLWLSQFENTEIELAVEILKQIQYYNETVVSRIIGKLAEYLRNILNNDFSNTFFFPLGTSSASSGGIFLYKFKQLLRVSDSAFPQTSVHDYLDKDVTIVFFDDIIGSGNQAITYYQDNLMNRKATYIYIALLGFSKGIERIAQKRLYSKVVVGERLTDSQMAFTDDSNIFEPDLKAKIYHMCKRYGKLLYSHPLGYDNSQALIVFSHNTPNNTLPIIWASSNNESLNKGYIWYPLWERRKYREPKKKKSPFDEVYQVIHRTAPFLVKIGQNNNSNDNNIWAIYVENKLSYVVCNICIEPNSTQLKDVITKKINEATFYKPQIIIFWVTSSILLDINDYIQEYCDIKKVCCIIKTQNDINQILQTKSSDDSNNIINILRSEISQMLFQPKEKTYEHINELEYNSQIIHTDHFLVDRFKEREILLDLKHKSFYLQGVSSSGKTQLLKSIVQARKQNNKIFWHTIRDVEAVVQIKIFISNLAFFFDSEFNDNSLLRYIADYEFTVTEQLLYRIKHCLQLFSPIIVIDDVHKCKEEGIDLKIILCTIINEKTCDIYFSGWFNIFENLNVNSVKYLDVKGLTKNHINEIICHNLGYSREDIATEIVNKCDGLPGFANMVNDNIDAASILSSNTLIKSLIDKLSHNERIVIFSLSYISCPIEIQYFSNVNLSQELFLLHSKRLINIHGTLCGIHDTYRTFVRSYYVDLSFFNCVLDVLKNAIKKHSQVAIDVIDVCIRKHKINKAYSLLSSNFHKFIHDGLENRTLSLLQQIEHNDELRNYCNEIIVQKVILMERCEQYELGINYYNLLQESFDHNSSGYFNLLYVYIRCLYFTNSFEEILSVFINKNDMILNNSNIDIRIQILLLVGRVYYIKGFLRETSLFYLLAYQYASESLNRVLCAKITYRIAMVECSYGLYKESKETFLKLLESDNALTQKRKSYIYNKISKCCCLLKNQIDEALAFNDLSKEIKEKRNDLRGLMYCYIQYAEIYLEKQDFAQAADYINKAEEIAIFKNLQRNIVEIKFRKIDVYMQGYPDMSEQLYIELLDCFKIAKKYKLLSSMTTGLKVANKYWSDRSNEIQIQDINWSVIDNEYIVDVCASHLRNCHRWDNLCSSQQISHSLVLL